MKNLNKKKKRSHQGTKRDWLKERFKELFCIGKKSKRKKAKKVKKNVKNN
jgi:hypothetical protein|tara:strand:+ start:2718 stop:2867 length:150 start_codon:yes stop_codon:yes gene_type:complete